MPAFEIQQPGLFLQTSLITYQRAMLADYTMAGNEQGQSIAVVRHPDRPAGLWIADSHGNFLIACRLAVFDGKQSFIHFLLKGGPSDQQGKGEGFSASGKILIQLQMCQIKQMMMCFDFRSLSMKREFDDVRVTASQIERAYRAVICSFVLHANYCTVPSQSWQGIRSTTLLVRNFHSVYPSIQVRWQ